MATELTRRRELLGGFLAAAALPGLSWADAGRPAFLSAAARAEGRYVLCGISSKLEVVFERALPARGHAAAAHPTRPEAVAFARRPGRFAMVVDCMRGAQIARLHAPEGRHFYGHGTFSSDGRLLYTTENDYAAGRGVIGVWDAQQHYRRVAEWLSGGVGPHDIKRLPGSDVLVVANGGIDTHPETGRTKLNIATMAPNLAYLDEGRLAETAVLPAAMHKNSIRHLAVNSHSDVAFGMQWQGDGPPDALVGVHRRGDPMQLIQAGSAAIREMDGYIGSIAFTPDGTRIAVTSPRGGRVQVYDAVGLTLEKTQATEDVCGVAALGTGFALTAGTGLLAEMTPHSEAIQRHVPLRWDNHLVAL